MTEPVIQVPALDTARLQLQCPMIEDAPAAHQAYGDPEAMRFWDMPPSIDLEETERRLKRALSVERQWHATWPYWLGPMASFPTMSSLARLALGWILISRFQRRRFMEEATRAVLTHCFTTLNTHRVEAEIEPHNHRSARLAQRPR